MKNQLKNENLVKGTIVDKFNRPLANLIVRVFDRDMRNEQLLGESVTDRDGRYKINWSHSQLSGRGRKTADISLRVLTSEKKTELYVSNIDEVRFNASSREEINITIEKPINPEVIEYDFLLKEVRFLVARVKVEDLQENEEHQDITFIARELEIPAEKIEHLVVAHRVRAEYGIDAAFFYALLRKNTLLKNDFVKSFQARLSVGINTDLKLLIYDASLADKKKIESDIKSAIREMLVSKSVERNWKKNFDRLQKFRQKAENYYKNVHPEKVLSVIGRFVLEDKISEIGEVFQASKNDLNTFLKKITDDSFFKSQSKANDAKTSIRIAELIGFDDVLISQVRKKKSIKNQKDVKKLAELSHKEWKKILAKSENEIRIFGEKINSETIDFQATALMRKMEKEFPGVALKAHLKREKKDVLENQTKIINFLTKHDDFDIRRNNIDEFLKKKRFGDKKHDAMRNELKSVQRIAKLMPDYRKTFELKRKNIDSAQNIVAIGKTRFVKEIAPEVGIKSEKEADQIFRKAEKINTATMLIAGELQDTIRAKGIPALEIPSLKAKLEEVSKDFPNLKTLFKLTDTCECEHCRSVYSPAAYLAEVLQFLDKRSVTDLTVDPPITNRLAKTVLFERRPDLGDIDLSCENANTPLPYIDLVCELLEEAISPDPGVSYSGVLSDGANPLTGKISNDLLTKLQSAGIPVTDQAQIFETETQTGSANTFPHYLRDKKAVCKILHNTGDNYKIFRLRQTLSSAEELAAAPEYVNSEAYNILKDIDNAFAFKLPFDLNHTEANAYFSRFDVSRANLMEDFQLSDIPSNETIAAESLGLTDSERKLIVSPNVSKQDIFWNTADTNASNEMNRVDIFLTKSGLTYKELDLLLRLKYIDPNNNLFIRHNDFSCDTGRKKIANLDDSILDRIHRFLRLQKKIEWKFEDLDEIISQARLGNGKLDDNDDDGDGITNGNECLIKTSQLNEVSKQTGIKITELMGFYGEIPHKVLGDDAAPPLYQKVFLNKAKNGFIDEGLLPEKIDGSQLLSNFKSSIAVCLQISEKDFDELMPALTDGNLTFANLSYLYAASHLMRKLKLKADEFVVLVKLTGIDVRESPEATLNFLKAYKDAKNYSLKLSDIQFMLQHKSANLSDRELKNGKIKQILESLQSDLQKSFDLNRSPFDSGLTAVEQKETLQNLLSKLRGIDEKDVTTLLGFIDKDWKLPSEAKDLKDFVDDNLAFIDKENDIIREGFDTSKIKEKIDELDNAGADKEAQRKALIEAFFEAISLFQFEIEKHSILEVHLISAFNSNDQQIKTVLKYAKLKQNSPGTDPDLIRDLLFSNSLIDTDITHAIPSLTPITGANFPEQYQSLRLLHKLIPLIDSFDLDITLVEWFLENNSDLDWFAFDSIPFETGQTGIKFKKYSAFAEMVLMAKQLKPVLNPEDAENPITFLNIIEMLLENSVSRTEFLKKFSLLTGYLMEDADAVDAHLFPVFSLENYRQVQTWKAVGRCVEHLRKLGTNILQVKEFIKPELNSTDTNQLRMTLKARYDDDTWLSTLREIMDTIRSQKRNALVAYLLARHPEINDENDLYDLLLVDVEMEACMPSSRIVQAHGTIQLFVQRCLMGLEPQAAADLDNDKSWEQWKWMKNYRVWEANRKVFLYPENWIEAELRDDKSFMFKELEDELLQNELNEFTSEQALIKYLEKLDDIAFLEVVATWYQSDIKTMHVFARTKGGDPAIYYYRRFEKERYWTAWEKVELDINSEHLLAFVRNNRLTLAWTVLSEEPDPRPESNIPNPTDTNPVPNDLPKRKLKIQLAISEFANNIWQPKKISTGAILTPHFYTTENFQTDKFNLIYEETDDQINIISSIEEGSHDYYRLRGTFDLTGCKGYPELAYQGYNSIPDFLPDFKDTYLNSQRYKELLGKTNALSVRKAFYFFDFRDILEETPGKFRITYPHQSTAIDLVARLFQNLISYLLQDKDRESKTPYGTMLPYFMEDSNYGYVIIPGLYSTVKETGKRIDVKRTASDVIQLIQDIFAVLKLVESYQKTPNGEKLKKIQDDLLKIKKELSVYMDLNYGEKFKNMYHPLVCSLRTTLYKHGVAELMKRDTQMQKTEEDVFDFETHFKPTSMVPPKYPVEDIDFSSDGSYSGYNWELFFHIPFLIATRLTKNQRFEEAMDWFHYMFNPTGALKGKAPQKYWVTKPFYQTYSEDYFDQRIDILLGKVSDPDAPEIEELEFAINEWRDKPFKPHVVARFRPVAYQKAVLMKYIDNLTEWGDHLFRQDTMESIAQATQMYILADKLLGAKPGNIPSPVKLPSETYNQIESKLDAFGNALIDLENILPELSALPEDGAELPPTPGTLSMFYFCIPHNEKMLEYWDRIEDRLFKIRHCQNIDGVERSLALFAPPIDPGMLVKAFASGLDISSILAGLNAPTPYYRFNILSQKATELVQEVKGLGSSLLQALEKKDAEAISLLRSESEIKVLKSVRDMKVLQIDEAEEQIESLKKTKQVTEEKHKYYRDIGDLIPNEKLNLDKLEEAKNWQLASNITYALGAGLALIPDIQLGASGFGGSPHGAAKFGGSLLANSTDALGKGLSIFSAIASYEANRASILGGYDRRFADWKLNERLADKELLQIDQQIVAAEIRKEIAEKDLKNHNLQIKNAEKTDDFMRSKFTNEELYQWMIGQISSVYFRAYQLAYDFAKKAERSYQFELGNNDTFIDYGYWDSMKKGLQSADHLFHDIKRMETSYLDKNKREYELTKHISLTMLDPLALVKLRATGSCDFEIPEAIYDMDYPGQYFRRIKSVSLSLPCIAGPYTSVSAKLSLVSNRYRKNTNSAGTGYAEVSGNDERFNYKIGAIQSIAASSAQNDSGVFELNFRDERYLPFEGTGAISRWKLELPEEVRQFDYDSISDVVLHINYTAREGGSNLKNKAETILKNNLAGIKQELEQTGLHITLNMKHNLPGEWHLLKKDGQINLTIDKSRLPYFVQSDAAIENVMFVAKVKNNPANYEIKIGETSLDLSRIDEWNLCRGNKSDIKINSAFKLSIDKTQIDNLEELLMVVKYSF